ASHMPQKGVSKKKRIAMPAKGMSRQTDRDCLVCGQTTRIAHLGIDTCRSCAVFYRRLKNGHDYICRSSSGRCARGKGLNCQRRRFDHIVRLLKQGPTHEFASSSTSTALHTSDSLFTKPTDFAILERLKTHYSAMSLHRLCSELNSRSNPPHPLEISLEKGPFFPADFAALTGATRILMSAALEFGSNAFPEFAGLPESDKWTIAMNFFYRFRMFEGFYRSTKIFTNDENKYFVSYALYFTIPFDEGFLKTAPEGADIPGVLRYMAKSEMCCWIKNARAEIIRVDPTEEEFIAVVVLMFWPHGDPSVSEDINRIGEKYRGEILKELHAYYRDEMGRDDYASRIGELMMLIQMFERTKDLKEQFEVMRLFNIMTDDNFIY
ncbi:hypothetical protein PENTCL1PPCAC_15598, partial [Pristionchus entomophagus]